VRFDNVQLSDLIQSLTLSLTLSLSLSFSLSALVKKPSERVFRMLQETDENTGHAAHPLFLEMEVLTFNTSIDDYEWTEMARWVKFEEDVEYGGNRWSKPHVATLGLDSLFELRHMLHIGVSLFDLKVSA
jgi:hypothetical protein